MSNFIAKIMKSRSRWRWLTAIVTVGATWMVAYFAVYGLRSFTVTAETVIARIQATPLAGISHSERKGHLDNLADTINRLELDERTRLRQSGALEDLFTEMTEQEQTMFLEATLPRGMEQMMEAVNAMPVEERRRMVDRALRSLMEAAQEEISEELEDVHARMIVEQGLAAYFEVASAQTKLEVAPLIEHLQRRLQRVD